MNAEHWAFYYLLVTVPIGTTPATWLLDHMSQEEFMEYYTSGVTRSGPPALNVMPLTEASFDILRSSYEDRGRLLEGA